MDDDVTIDFYWRPGCGFCGHLDRQLKKTGLPTVKHNIWEDPEAAAFVRSVARGNETVPTIRIGSWVAVNPGHRQVLDAAREHAPELVEAARGDDDGAGERPGVLGRLRRG